VTAILPHALPLVVRGDRRDPRLMELVSA